MKIINDEHLIYMDMCQSPDEYEKIGLTRVILGDAMMKTDSSGSPLHKGTCKDFNFSYFFYEDNKEWKYNHVSYPNYWDITEICLNLFGLHTLLTKIVIIRFDW